jgi:hypothetical protein
MSKLRSSEFNSAKPSAARRRSLGGPGQCLEVLREKISEKALPKKEEIGLKVGLLLDPRIEIESQRCNGLSSSDA